MTETKFTPGPWVVSGKLIIGPIINSDDQCNGFIEEICDASCGAGDPLANAHLIAAAPDLYEALSDLVDALSDKLGGISAVFGEAREITDARAALAKARGEA